MRLLPIQQSTENRAANLREQLDEAASRRKIRSSGWRRIRSAADELKGVLLDKTTLELLHEESDDHMIQLRQLQRESEQGWYWVIVPILLGIAAFIVPQKSS